MKLRALALVLIAAAACKKGRKEPEWFVSGVGNLHAAGALELFDRANGDNTECGLAGVWEPTDQNPDLYAAYRAALGKLVDQKVVGITVVEAAETVQQTKTTRLTAGLDQCEVTVGGASVGPALVASGWGRAKQFAAKPIVDAEAAARAAHLGMWSPQGRDMLLGQFAKLNGVTIAQLPVTAELSYALKQAAYWQPRLAYLDIDVEDVIAVTDAQGQRLPHWKTLPDPHPSGDAGVQ